MVADPQPAGHYPYQGWPTGLYTRASYAVGDKSVSDQETIGRQWAADQRAVVHDVYCDNSKSASRFATLAREHYERLVQDITAGRVRIVWFWALNRSQRRLGVYADLRDLCRARGVLWVVAGRIYDLNDRGDRLSSAFTAILDEELPDQISENVRRGLASNAINGKPHAHEPYGYRRIYEMKKVVGQEIREDQAAIIRDVAKRFLRGETLSGIAEYLNRTGVPAPQGGRWQPVQVRRLIDKPLYAGKRVHRGVVVADAIWPAILDEKTFYACQTKLAAQSALFTRDNAVKHLLSGIATCSVCKEPSRVSTGNGHPFYICAKRCSALRVEWLDEYIQDLLLLRLGQPDALEWLAEPARDDAASDAETDLKTLKERLEQLYDDAAHGRVSATYGGQVEARLLPQIEEATKRAKVLRVSPVLRDAARPDIAKVWPSYLLPRRREIIRALLEIQIVPVGRGWTGGFDECRVDWGWKIPAKG